MPTEQFDGGRVSAGLNQITHDKLQKVANLETLLEKKEGSIISEA